MVIIEGGAERQNGPQRRKEGQDFGREERGGAGSVRRVLYTTRGKYGLQTTCILRLKNKALCKERGERSPRERVSSQGVSKGGVCKERT